LLHGEVVSLFEGIQIQGEVLQMRKYGDAG